MDYTILAREIQKLGYGRPENIGDPNCAKEYVETLIQQIERRSSRFEALVQEHDVSED